MKYILEICAGSIRSALAARDGGADRIELCDNLSEGGTTPSYGMIKTCRSLLHIPVFPIIRPRGGDFVYSEEEFEVMKRDVIFCRELGCGGIVLGILDKNGNIDMKRCADLISLRGTMQITFHRAFDHCNDLKKGLEDVVSLGCDRILTSGGQMYAIDAIPNLRALLEQAENRISIMPGSGITDENLLKIARGTGAYEFHSTAKKLIHRGMDSLNPDQMKIPYLFETDTDTVVKMQNALKSIIDL